jgi:hypothetical protein
MGEFADASFADDQYSILGHAKQDNAVIIGRQVIDLHKFWHGLMLLVDILGERKGHGDASVKALRRLADGTSDVIVDNKDLSYTKPPPNLKPLIVWAQELEDMFGQGGVADETEPDAYVRYITAERTAALKEEQEHGRVVWATKEEALRPCRQEELRVEPELVSIHGPWQLVKADWCWPRRTVSRTTNLTAAAMGRLLMRTCPRLESSRRKRRLAFLSCRARPTVARTLAAGTRTRLRFSLDPTCTLSICMNRSSKSSVCYM